MESIRYYITRALKKVDSFYPLIPLLGVLPNKIILDIKEKKRETAVGTDCPRIIIYNKEMHNKGNT